MLPLTDILLSYAGMAICFLAGYWRGRRVQLERCIQKLENNELAKFSEVYQKARWNPYP